MNFGLSRPITLKFNVTWESCNLPFPYRKFDLRWLIISEHFSSNHKLSSIEKVNFHIDKYFYFLFYPEDVCKRLEIR
jgi:hypothetical protein